MEKKKIMDDTERLIGITKFGSALLVLLVIFLVLHIGISVNSKRIIKEGLTDLVDNLKEQSGAETIDVNVYSGDNNFKILPTDLEYHAYLTVNVDNVKRKTEKDWLSILMNGKKDADKDYGYYNDKYAYYTRTLTVSYLKSEVPVFVTITDGNISYCLYKDSSWNDIQLKRADAYTELMPSNNGKTINTMIIIITVLSVVLGLLKYRVVKLKRNNVGKTDLSGFTREESLSSEQNNIRKKQYNKKIIIAIVGILTVVVIFLVIKMIVIPTNTYNEAVALRTAGKDEEAYNLFKSLGNFLDAKRICNEYDYNDAICFLEKGYYGRAYVVLKNTSGYADADKAAQAILEEFPQVEILTAHAGDEITLGKYEQDNNLSNGAEPIVWVVLYNHDGLVYAVSRDIIDAQQFNTERGDGSTLKKWLKEEFNEKAFEDIDEGFINKIGLISAEDIEEYSEFINMKPGWTAYAMSKDPDRGYNLKYSWWLDGEYLHDYGGVNVLMTVCDEDGIYSGYTCSVTDVNGVRPAITIDASCTDVDYYLEDYDDINNAGIETRTRTKTIVDRIVGNDSNNSESNSDKIICSRCDGTGRVTKHYGNSWNKKEGYGYGDVCGACNGTGYLNR